MEQSAMINCLLDFYGPLLTKRQRELLQLRVEEDLSLSEIAENLEISRQAVSDGLKNAQQQLLKFEESLGLYARSRRVSGSIQSAIDEIDRGKTQKARQLLQSIMMEENNGL